MKKIAVLLLALALSTSAAAQKVERHFDRFQGLTTFNFGNVGLPEGARLFAFYTCAEDVQSCTPGEVELTFLHMSDSWRFLNDHHFILLLDGKDHIDVGTKGYDGQAGIGGVSESQMVGVTPEQLS